MNLKKREKKRRWVIFESFLLLFLFYKQKQQHTTCHNICNNTHKKSQKKTYLFWVNGDCFLRLPLSNYKICNFLKNWFWQSKWFLIAKISYCCTYSNNCRIFSQQKIFYHYCCCYSNNVITVALLQQSCVLATFPPENSRKVTFPAR